MRISDKNKLRRREILKAVIDDYIETAEPVGSKNLVKRHGFDVSSATVRNTMSELEKEGYLESPHSSSGRVPTDKGYRIYVDDLMSVDVLSTAEREEIRDEFSGDFGSLPELLKEASQVLSEKTGYTSLALTPKLQKTRLSQMKMLMIEPGKVLLIVVLSAGLVKDRLIRLPDILSEKEISRLSSLFEERLGGMALEEITLVTVASALDSVKLPEVLLNQILYETYVALKQAENLDTYVDGVEHIFSHPEFRDGKKAGTLIDSLADNGILIGLMDEADEGVLEQDTEVHRLHYKHEDPDESKRLPDHASGSNALSVRKHKRFVIRIGQELALESMKDCSFLSTCYCVDDEVSGKIAVIGPKRMPYEKLVAQVSFVRETVENMIGQSSSHDKKA